MKGQQHMRCCWMQREKLVMEEGACGCQKREILLRNAEEGVALIACAACMRSFGSEKYRSVSEVKKLGGLYDNAIALSCHFTDSRKQVLSSFPRLDGWGIGQ